MCHRSRRVSSSSTICASVPTSVTGARSASSGVTPKVAAIASAIAGAIVGEVHEADERLDLEVVEVFAGRVAQPLDLLVGSLAA